MGGTASIAGPRRSEAWHAEEPVHKAVLDVLAHLAGIFIKKGRAALCLWAVDFPPTSVLPPHSRPPRLGRSPQRRSWGSGTRVSPTVALDLVSHQISWRNTDAWAPFQTTYTSLGAARTGVTPTARLPAAQPRWRSSSGGAGQSSSTLSCLDVTSSCFSSLWFCYKFKAKLKM